MKLLLDSCISGTAASELRAAGLDVLYAGEWNEDPGDDEILARAYEECRILVTLDKDFGELAIVRGTAHAGIIRLVNMSAKQQALTCLQILERYSQELGAGAIVTAEPGYARIRPPQT
ncbi:MAG: toxin-antitoxin system, toxin component, PIN family protein [Chloroflexi bacterium]|nr:toxin-antitoxin system, toxin component, PIN family protein [Chloroflexota bacterium]MDL1885776.1 toxin-antitoxin system, toxin component, PIN family protein [Anaerolineae bacterium CFX8]